MDDLPVNMAPGARRRVVAHRRAIAAERGEPDPYPDEPEPT